MSKLGEFSPSWCFPSHPKVTWWCRSWGRTWGRCWSCSGCQRKRSSIWFIRCSEVWRWRTLLWSHIVHSLLVDVIVLRIKSLFYSFITVHSLCWYNSQGKLSFHTHCVCVINIVFTRLIIKRVSCADSCPAHCVTQQPAFHFPFASRGRVFCISSAGPQTWKSRRQRRLWAQGTRTNTTKLSLFLAINAFNTPASSVWVRCTRLLFTSCSDPGLWFGAAGRQRDDGIRGDSLVPSPGGHPELDALHSDR